MANNRRDAERSLKMVQESMRVQAAMHAALDSIVEAGIAEVGRTWALPVLAEVARDQLLRIDQYVAEMVDDLESRVPGISEVASDMEGNLLLDGDGLLAAWFDGDENR